MKRKFVSILTLLACSISAHADAVSLGDDFSLASNPNGLWSYQNGVTNLTYQAPQNNGNSLIPALSGGFWGISGDINTSTPEIFKAQVNGSSAGETNGDFLALDIVGHSPNDGGTLFARWTAPFDGTISDLVAKVWYAHSVVTRSNDFVLLENSSILGAGTVSSTLNSNRSTPATVTAASFNVVAGDVISLGIKKTTGQSFGSLSGMALDFTYTPVPEPGSAVLLVLGLGCLGARFRMRGDQR